MTGAELLATIADLQAHTCELDDLEVKSARGGTPQRLYEDISAFANTRDGVLLFGLDEHRGFAIVGVSNAQQLQADLANSAAQLAPQPVVHISHHVVDGKDVVVAEVDAVPPSQRPAHLKSGDEANAWVRVGNSTQRMSSYQVFGYLSARSQPTFDQEVITQAGMDDLDADLLAAFVEGLRRDRPRARVLRPTMDETLMALGIVCRIDGVPHPTLGGLLAFGRHPQQFEPQLVITFLWLAAHGHPGVSETRDSRGSRECDCTPRLQ